MVELLCWYLHGGCMLSHCCGCQGNLWYGLRRYGRPGLYRRIDSPSPILFIVVANSIGHIVHNYPYIQFELSFKLCNPPLYWKYCKATQKWPPVHGTTNIRYVHCCWLETPVLGVITVTWCFTRALPGPNITYSISRKLPGYCKPNFL